MEPLNHARNGRQRNVPVYQLHRSGLWKSSSDLTFYKIASVKQDFVAKRLFQLKLANDSKSRKNYKILKKHYDDVVRHLSALKKLDAMENRPRNYGELRETLFFNLAILEKSFPEAWQMTVPKVSIKNKSLDK